MSKSVTKKHRRNADDYEAICKILAEAGARVPLFTLRTEKWVKQNLDRPGCIAAIKSLRARWVVSGHLYKNLREMEHFGIHENNFWWRPCITNRSRDKYVKFTWQIRQDGSLHGGDYVLENSRGGIQTIAERTVPQQCSINLTNHSLVQGSKRGKGSCALKEDIGRNLLNRLEDAQKRQDPLSYVFFIEEWTNVIGQWIVEDGNGGFAAFRLSDRNTLFQATTLNPEMAELQRWVSNPPTIKSSSRFHRSNLPGAIA